MAIAIPLNLEGPKVANGVAMRFWADALFEDVESRRRMPNQVPALILAIESRARTSLICRLSVKTIREVCFMGSQTAKKCFDALVEEGWLVRIRYGSRELNLAAEYQLAIPRKYSKKFVDLKLVDPHEKYVFTHNQLSEDEQMNETLAVEDVAMNEAKSLEVAAFEEDELIVRHQVLCEEMYEVVEKLEDGWSEEKEEREQVEVPEVVQAAWIEETINEPEEDWNDRIARFNEQEKRELASTAKYVKNEYGEWVVQAVEPDPSEMTEEEFEAWLDARIGNEQAEEPLVNMVAL